MNTDTLPDLDLYVALGEAKLAERAERARRERERQEGERREALRRAWAPLLDRLPCAMPPAFVPYIVEPDEGPFGGFMQGDHRPLVIDLTPLGLGPIGALCDSTKEEMVGFLPPTPERDDGGRTVLSLPPSVQRGDVSHVTYTFCEALALTKRRALEIEASAQAGGDEPQPPDPYAPLAAQGGGCYPVLRVGLDRAEVHAGGAAAADEFGLMYGDRDWRRSMAVHTWTFTDAPVEGGSLYAYCALIRVAPEMWPLVAGGRREQTTTVTERE